MPSPSQNDSQLVHRGTVIGFVAGATDFAIVSDGSYSVHAYVSQTGTGKPVLGSKVSVYKQNSTYYVGNVLQ